VTKAILNGIAYMQNKYNASVLSMTLGKDVTSPYMLEWSQKFHQDSLTVPLNQIYLGIPVVNIGKGVSEKPAPAPPALESAPLASKPAAKLAKQAKQAKPKKRKKKAKKTRAVKSAESKQAKEKTTDIWDQLSLIG
jgi:hypothetical protein